MKSFRTMGRLPFFILPLLLAVLHAGPALAQAGSGGKAEKAIHLHSLPDGSSFAPRADSEARSAEPRALAVSTRLREALATLAGKTSPGTSAGRLLPSQRQAFQALREKSGPGLEVRIRRHAGTPLEIKGSCLALAAVDLAPGEDRDETTARSFLRSHAALLLLDEPDRELSFLGGKADELGKRHLRFSQTFHGLPVWPADLLVEIDEAGNVDRLSGAFVATPKEVGTEPAVDAAHAAVLALAAVPRAGPATAGGPSLLVYAPGDRSPRLAWRVEVSVSAASQWLVLVDAVDGTILTAFNQVMSANAPGSSNDLLGIPRALDLWEEGGTFHLVNTVKAMFDATSKPPSPATTRGAIIILDARNNPPNSDPQTIPPLFHVTSTDASSGFVADGVSAAFGLSETYDYYLDRHSRDSLDGNGGTILAGVRLGSQYLNAFWLNGQMFFGDGAPFAASLDV
ncbi:MAG TPA: hypothetical protein VMT52_00245, partial [Planctomycetota bacterium]|nr:hypothetical protein [Planctomycetota bacterium]